MTETEKLSPHVKIIFYFMHGKVLNVEAIVPRAGQTNDDFAEKYKLSGGLDEFIVGANNGVFRYRVSNIYLVSVEDYWRIGEGPNA